MKWAVAQGYRPAFTAVLPKCSNGTTHHRTLNHTGVADALRKVRESCVAVSTRLAIEFLALTAARTTEVRLAAKSEIDRETRVWTIPAERMEAGREHRVPLSTAALRVLDEARQNADSELVFPGESGQPVGHGVLAATFRRLDIGTVHGLRSSFRDWCSETGVSYEVTEQALAHTVRGVEGAYARSDLLSSGYTSGGGYDGPLPFRFSVEFAVAERQIALLEVFEDDMSEGEGFPPPRVVVPVIIDASS